MAEQKKKMQWQATSANERSRCATPYFSTEISIFFKT
jgi:hypothetical protein